MKIKCHCNIWHNTMDPKTFNYFDKYEVKPLSKKEVGKDKVFKEIIFVLNCVKDECTILKVIRYGKVLNKKAILETEEYSNKEALEYMEENIKNWKPVDIPIPGKKVQYVTRHIPWSYPKFIDEKTQRKRYTNEQGWSDLYEKGILRDKWVPDKFVSEVKISQLAKA